MVPPQPRWSPQRDGPPRPDGSRTDLIIPALRAVCSRHQGHMFPPSWSYVPATRAVCSRHEGRKFAPPGATGCAPSIATRSSPLPTLFSTDATTTPWCAQPATLCTVRTTRRRQRPEKHQQLQRTVPVEAATGLDPSGSRLETAAAVGSGEDSPLACGTGTAPDESRTAGVDSRASSPGHTPPLKSKVVGGPASDGRPGSLSWDICRGRHAVAASPRVHHPH